MRSLLAALATILSAVALFGTARAEAAPNMLVGIYDDGQTLFNTEQACAGYRQLHVQVLRVMLRWSTVARRRPQVVANENREPDRKQNDAEQARPV